MVSDAAEIRYWWKAEWPLSGEIIPWADVRSSVALMSAFYPYPTLALASKPAIEQPPRALIGGEGIWPGPL